jgi:hypothetical protein
MDSPQRGAANFPSNIALETGSIDSVKALVRLQAEAAADDFLLDLGGAAEVLLTCRRRMSPPVCNPRGDARETPEDGANFVGETDGDG